MPTPTHENSDIYVTWLLLRLLSQARKSRENCTIVKKHAIRGLKEILGKNYYREADLRQMRSENLRRIGSELVRVGKEL